MEIPSHLAHLPATTLPLTVNPGTATLALTPSASTGSAMASTGTIVEIGRSIDEAEAAIDRYLALGKSPATTARDAVSTSAGYRMLVERLYGQQQVASRP